MFQYARRFEQLRSEFITLGLLLSGFAASLTLRVSLGGRGVAYSWPAGITFATCLILLSLAAKTKTIFNYKAAIVGVIYGSFLLIPAVLANQHNARPVGNYAAWSIVVSFVALAEEFFLRGALFDVIKKLHSESSAILVAAFIFALLHVPLYGWHVVPLDFFVGMYLGAARSFSGTWVASGIAHSLADLAGWWLV